MTRKTITVVAFASFVGVIVGANWALNTFGVVTVIGVAMPAGVLFAGAAFGIRDVLHETAGSRTVLAAIAVGTALSAALSDSARIPGGYTTIAIASGAAFAVSELLDLSVYAPLRRRHWPAAVAASNLVGSVTDSLLFLLLAFGSIAYAGGQIVGKFSMVALALPAVWMVRRALSVHNVKPTSAVRNDETGVIGGDDDA
jgi:uncharacterized PurR-regulated membrane protein YhhQ (DUF165 family)